MDIKIVDTTLRDGEQRAGIAFAAESKVKIAKLLDSLGIYQIEAGIPAMGGDEVKGICRIVECGLKSKISVWNRMNVNDIKRSLECEAEIIHVSVPVSDIQINSKLKKSREWILENLKKCIGMIIERGRVVTIGMEDASRADNGFIQQVIAAAKAEGVNRIRYADTVGILRRKHVFDEMKRMKENYEMDIEIHMHNDFGMAVANSVSAVMAGAKFVDCTIGGIGERAGNCDYAQFICAAQACFGVFKEDDFNQKLEIQKEILSYG